MDRNLVNDKLIKGINDFFGKLQEIHPPVNDKINQKIKDVKDNLGNFSAPCLADLNGATSFACPSLVPINHLPLFADTLKRPYSGWKERKCRKNTWFI
jgi:hypothetical protein